MYWLIYTHAVFLRMNKSFPYKLPIFKACSSEVSFSLNTLSYQLRPAFSKTAFTKSRKLSQRRTRQTTTLRKKKTHRINNEWTDECFSHLYAVFHFNFFIIPKKQNHSNCALHLTYTVLLTIQSFDKMLNFLQIYLGLLFYITYKEKPL